MVDNGQICRLCLLPLTAGGGRAIEEIEKEMLQLLLINIDFNATSNAIACDKCLDTLQYCFDFKSTCFYIDDLVNSDVVVDFKNEMVNNESLCMKNFQVCRLCMLLIEDETFNYTTNADSNDGIHKDFNTAHESLICKRCLSTKKKYNDFVNTCREVELTIKNYCQVKAKYGITDRVNLDDVLKFKNHNTFSKPIVIKKECLDVEITDAKVMWPENRDIVSIKCEEIDIKDESDIDRETVKLADNNSGSSNELMEIKTSVSEEHRCTLCNFITDTQLSLKAHMMSHRGPTKKYGCHVCPYEAKFLSGIVEHLLKHKDKSEVEMHKCPSCPYETKYKGTLQAHQKVKHQENIEMYKCKECSFSTKYKSYLKNHQVLHKDPRELPIYKCETCDYKTRFKHYFIKHKRTHKELASKRQQTIKLPNKFQCKICPYKTKWCGNLSKHVMIHSSERPYSCDQCTYTAKCSSNLLVHKRLHQKNEKGRYRCQLCTYQAGTNMSVRIHMMKDHTNLKCAHCPYETAIRRCLVAHIKRLHGSESLPEFKCQLCPYVTKDKGYLQKHLLVHREATMQCNQCDFRTKQERYLQYHIKRCHTGSVPPRNGEDLSLISVDSVHGQKPSLLLQRLELGKTMI